MVPLIDRGARDPETMRWLADWLVARSDVMHVDSAQMLRRLAREIRDMVAQETTAADTAKATGSGQSREEGRGNTQ